VKKEEKAEEIWRLRDRPFWKKRGKPARDRRETEKAT
jgi:hypothetical protein